MTQSSILDKPKAARLIPSSISVANVGGIPDYKLELGPHWTVFKGSNGVGKSSMLAAGRNVIMGGAALAQIARVGEDGTPFDPEVTLVLKSVTGGDEKRITKTADKTPSIKSRIGTSAAFETVKKPGEYLKTIADHGSDPAKFLLASEKDQLEMLLAALPLEWNQARVDEIIGGFKAVIDAENLPMEHLYPLQRVGAIRDSIFRARTGVNRDEKAKRSAADQTLRDAPGEIPEGLEARIAEKRDELSALQASLSAGQEAWRGKHRAAETAAAAKRDAAIAAAKAAYDAEMSAANLAAADDKAALSDLQRALDNANAELSALLRDQTDATKAATMHATADKFLRDADSLKGTADRMTAVIEALDAYKAEMASDIPIAGLTIEGGIKIAGVPFSQVNTATKVGVAFSVATMRCRDLPLRTIFIDGLECLDEQHRTILFDLAKAQGVYVIAAMVTADETLTVERG